MKIRIDKINSPRTENTLILYKDELFERNEYGIELAVDKDGIVSNISTLVKLPEGGYIISAHGFKHDLLHDNIRLGSQIKIDEESLNIVVQNNMFIRTEFLVNNLLDDIVGKYDECKKNDLNVDYPNALEAIERIRNNSKLIIKVKNDEEKLILIENEVNSDYEKAYQYLTISETLEARGVWHRPVEASLEELEEMLDSLADMNINDLYVEAFWNGFTIYPSKIVPVHPYVNFDYGKYGNDYLKALIEEAKIRDIHVHAWVENFFVGALQSTNSSLWEDNPSWQIINYNGLNHQTGKPGKEEEGFLFFDPSNKDVQKFIINLYKEMISLYDIKGLQLDYIRYPAGNLDYKLSSGYNLESVNKFKKLHDLDVDILDYVKVPENYELWNQYRSDIITDFVEDVYNEVMPLNPKLLFSIAVGPNAKHAKDNLMQEWKVWVQKGWIDIVAPMAYVRSRNQINQIVNDMNEITQGNTFNYTGVSPTYDNLTEIMNTHLIDESRNSNALGNVIFAYHNLRRSKSTREVLKRGTHRNKSVRPHDSIEVSLSNMINETNIQFDIKKYVETKESLLQLKNDLTEILKNITNKNHYIKVNRVLLIVNIKIKRIQLTRSLNND